MCTLQNFNFNNFLNGSVFTQEPGEEPYSLFINFILLLSEKGGFKALTMNICSHSAAKIYNNIKPKYISASQVSPPEDSI